MNMQNAWVAETFADHTDCDRSGSVIIIIFWSNEVLLCFWNSEYNFPGNIFLETLANNIIYWTSGRGLRVLKKGKSILGISSRLWLNSWENFRRNRKDAKMTLRHGLSGAEIQICCLVVVALGKGTKRVIVGAVGYDGGPCSWLCSGGRRLRRLTCWCILCNVLAATDQNCCECALFHVGFPFPACFSDFLCFRSSWWSSLSYHVGAHQIPL